MAGGGERKSSDFYGVLGLERECTQSDLKNAYKKLAMRWHPDRCSSSGNSKFVEEAKKNFQSVQEAYSVLSDETKRFMYDVGVYDNDDDENNHGMGEFLNEMATMMCENKPSENGEESFEQLQELFDEIFQGDNNEAFASTSQGMSPCSSSLFGSMESSCVSNKRSCSEMNDVEGSSPFTSQLQSFCVGTGGVPGRHERGRASQQRAERGDSSNCSSSRREGRKLKISSAHDVSYTGIST